MSINGNHNSVVTPVTTKTMATDNLMVRRARLSDVPEMMHLLNEYARQMEILVRAENEVYQTIREWVVAVDENGKIAGMGALSILWGDLAEVRSLVVDPARHSRGIGRKIVTLLLEDARQLNIPLVFALTRKPGFFLKLGFEPTRKEYLPRKVMKDCVFCPKFQSCDEVAVQMKLAGGREV